MASKLTEEEQRLIAEALPRRTVYPVGRSGVWSWDGYEYVHVRTLNERKYNKAKGIRPVASMGEIVDKLREGMPVEDIAKQVGMTVASLKSKIWKNHLLDMAGLKELPLRNKPRRVSKRAIDR